MEGSPRRAAIAASRCVELSNVEVVADDFHHLPLGTTFDVVTLIGVVEYARLFSRNPSVDAVDAILARALQFLKSDGLLILAIENQLGLKYFAGSREDHVGRAMFGVEDRYAKNGVVTFGRRELANRLRGVGLQGLEWWFPQPDYKLPICVLSDRLEDLDVDADLSALFSESVRAEVNPPPAPIFSLEQAWRPVYRNGLWGDLANSFLVVGSRKPLPRRNVLAEYYGLDRLPQYSKTIRFLWEAPNVVVHREQIGAIEPDPSQPISIRLEDEVAQLGQVWHAELVRLLNNEGWTNEEWTHWARRWLDAALRSTRPPHGACPTAEAGNPWPLH